MNSCKHLVEEFLHDSPYSLLLEKESAEVLCATRRSAGLPFMVQAFTASEPKLNNQAALKAVFRDLMPLALSAEGISMLCSTLSWPLGINIPCYFFYDL